MVGIWQRKMRGDVGYKSGERNDIHSDNNYICTTESDLMSQRLVKVCGSFTNQHKIKLIDVVQNTKSTVGFFFVFECT